MRHAAKRAVLGATTALAAGLASLLIVGGAAAAEPTQVTLGAGTHAESLAVGPDGNIWFGGVRFGSSGPGVDVVGKVTSSGAVTEYELRGGSEAELGVSSIASGKEGRLWYTEPHANRVGRVTTGGQYEDFSLIAPGSLPMAIAAGPEGRLWVAEEGTSAVAEIDPGGEVTEFHLPPGARPRGIAVDALGNAWVTAPGVPAIAMVDGNGGVREFPMPAWNKRPKPASIVIGPDSNPWFSDEAGPWLGMLEQRNGSWEVFNLEERRIPGKDSTSVVATGPLGDLWYTAGNRIGSMQPHGSIGATACTASGCGTPVTALTEGPDGNLWYATGIRRTGGGAGSIGVFIPPPISARIKTQQTRLHGRGVTIKIRCTGGAGGQSARSTIRVSGRLAGHWQLLGSRHYKCGPATDRQFSVRLRGATIAALRARGRLAAVVRMTFPGGKSAARRIVILPAAKA